MTFSVEIKPRAEKDIKSISNSVIENKILDDYYDLIWLREAVSLEKDLPSKPIAQLIYEIENNI